MKRKVNGIAVVAGFVLVFCGLSINDPQRVQAQQGSKPTNFDQSQRQTPAKPATSAPVFVATDAEAREVFSLQKQQLELVMRRNEIIKGYDEEIKKINDQMNAAVAKVQKRAGDKCIINPETLDCQAPAPAAK